MSEVTWFWIGIGINSLIAIIYMLWGIFGHRKVDEDGQRQVTGNQRIAYLLRGACMLLCPVIGIAFFVVGSLMRMVFFHGEADLDDVLFKKERVRQTVKADEERERNIVPIEEALVVNDHSKLRQVMLNVLKGDVDRSLASISLALNSEDSETSHYAASVLSKALDAFRVNVRKLEQEMDENEAQVGPYAALLIHYMNDVLKQNVFTKVEQEYFVNAMERACQRLYAYEQERDEIIPDETGNYCAAVAKRLMGLERFEDAYVWCERAVERYPKQYVTYQCRLEYLFSTGKKEEFLKVLDELKKSGIEIDRETLEMIRMFQ